MRMHPAIWSKFRVLCLRVLGFWVVGFNCCLFGFRVLGCWGLGFFGYYGLGLKVLGSKGFSFTQLSNVRRNFAGAGTDSVKG